MVLHQHALKYSHIMYHYFTQFHKTCIVGFRECPVQCGTLRWCWELKAAHQSWIIPLESEFCLPENVPIINIYVNVTFIHSHLEVHIQQPQVSYPFQALHWFHSRSVPPPGYWLYRSSGARSWPPPCPGWWCSPGPPAGPLSAHCRCCLGISPSSF